MLVNLKRRLPIWQAEGLISHDEATRILSYETTRGGRNWIGFGIAGIGVTAIVTGIISLVAANWESLSDAFKLTAYFLLHISVGGLLIRSEKKEGLWREVTLTLFALLFWAGIGLIGQVYHLSGAWWSVMLLWSFLTLPAALWAHSRLLPFVWCITAIVTPLVWFDATHISRVSEQAALFVLLTTAMILTTGHFVGQITDTLREEFRSALIVCGLGVLLVVATPWGNTLWNAGSQWGSRPVPWTFMAAGWCVTVVAMGASLLRVEQPFNLRTVSALVLLSVATYVSIPHVVDVTSLLPGALNDVAGAFGFLLVWGLAAAAAAIASRPKLFDVATVVLAIRFIVIYFEVFGSLTTTGVGLIVSGVVIVGIALLWNRGRKAVKELVREQS
jgi:uncharacterized membrane protein